METQKMDSEGQVGNPPNTESVEQTLQNLLEASNMSDESDTVTLLIPADSECSQEEESFASQIMVVEEVECDQESVLADQSDEIVEVESADMVEESAADEAVIIAVEEESAYADQTTETPEAGISNQKEEISVETPMDVAFEEELVSTADAAIIVSVEEEVSANKAAENATAGLRNLREDPSAEVLTDVMTEEDELASTSQSDESAETDVRNQAEVSSAEIQIVKGSAGNSDNIPNETMTSEEYTPSNRENAPAQKRKILSIEKGTRTILPNVKINILSKSQNKIQKTVPIKVDPSLAQKTASPKKPLILPKPPQGTSSSGNVQSNPDKSLKSLVFKPAQTSNNLKTFELQPLQSNATSFVLSSPLQLPKTTVAGSPVISQSLQKANIPANYALVRTNVGLALIPADQIKNAAVKKTVIPSTAGKLNSPKATTSPLLAPINTSKLPIVSALKLPTSVSPALKLPKLAVPSITPQSFKLPSQKNAQIPIKPSPHPPSRVNSNTVRIKLGSSSTEEKKSKVSFPFDVCRHPTCTAYRDKVDEDLRIKLHMRSRKIKSLRMAKQRCVRRAVMLKKAIGNLQRQNELLDSIEWLPESLSKEMLRVQMKPNCRRYHSQELKEFASKLHSISPKAYDIVREMFSKVLPQPKSIHNWIVGTDLNEGVIGAESVEVEEVEEVEEEAEESESDVEMAEGNEAECKIEIEPADNDFFS